MALLASALVAGLRLGWGAVRQRSLNPFATVMLLVFGIGLALTFVSGDPRFLLVKESFVTGAVGLTFLVTALRGRRPLTLAAQQSWHPEQAAELAAEYRDVPDGAARAPVRVDGVGYRACWPRPRCGCRWSTCCRST